MAKSSQELSSGRKRLRLVAAASVTQPVPADSRPPNVHYTFACIPPHARGEQLEERAA